MKSKLRNLLLAAMAITLFASCSNIALDDASVQSSESSDKCVLTISYDDLEGMLSENTVNKNVRTIDPGKYTKGANTTFKIEGTSSRNTSLTLQTISFDADKKATIPLEYDVWNLMLHAYDKDADNDEVEVLRGYVSGIDLRKQYTGPISFMLSTKNVPTHGNLDLKVKKIEKEIVKSYKAGLYDVNTGAEKYALADEDIENLTYTDHTIDGATPTTVQVFSISKDDIEPGDYVFKFTAYNAVKPNAGADDTRGELTTWSDIITIAPGRTTTDLVEITGIMEPPAVPLAFTVALDGDPNAATATSKEDYYTVVLNWTRATSANEDNFVLRIYESNGTEEDDPDLTAEGAKTALQKMTLVKTFDKDFYGDDDYWVEGTLGMATSSCKLRLPTGHLYEMTLTAKNNAGESPVKNREATDDFAITGYKHVNLQKRTYVLLGGAIGDSTENIVDYKIYGKDSAALRDYTSETNKPTWKNHPWTGWSKLPYGSEAISTVSDYKDIVVYAQYNKNIDVTYDIADEYKTLVVTTSLTEGTGGTADLTDGTLEITVTDNKVWTKDIVFSISTTSLAAADCEKIVLFVNGTMVGARDNVNNYSYSLNNFRIPETYNITVVGVKDGRNYSCSMPLTVSFNY